MPTVYQLKCDIRKIDPKAKITMNKAGLELLLRRLQLGEVKDKIKIKKNTIAELKERKMNRDAVNYAKKGLYGTKAIDSGKRLYTSV